MQQLSAMVLLHVESRLNSLHSCFDLLAASFFAMATLLPLEVAESVSEKSMLHLGVRVCESLHAVSFLMRCIPVSSQLSYQVALSIGCS